MNKETTFFRAIAFGLDWLVVSFVIINVDLLILDKIGIESYSLLTACILAYVFMLFRDVFGRSLGKYFLGVRILDSKSGNKAGLLQRLLKNITFPLSIIEGIVMLCQKKDRRWGDSIAKTKCELNENSYALSLFNKFIKTK